LGNRKIKEEQMTFTELVTKLATDHELTQVKVREILKSYEDTIIETVSDGETVKSSGFGTFYSVKLKPRKTPKGGLSSSRTTIRFRQSRS
jgi:nucleoid DNA-binding protein